MMCPINKLMALTDDSATAQALNITEELFLGMGMPPEAAKHMVPTADGGPRPHIRLERAEQAAAKGDVEGARVVFGTLLTHYAQLCEHHVRMTDGVFDWTHFKAYKAECNRAHKSLTLDALQMKPLDSGAAGEPVAATVVEVAPGQTAVGVNHLAASLRQVEGALDSVVDALSDQLADIEERMVRPLHRLEAKLDAALELDTEKLMVTLTGEKAAARATVESSDNDQTAQAARCLLQLAMG